MKIIFRIAAVILLSGGAAHTVRAQQILTLEECRELAVDNNNDLRQARQKAEIAAVDKKIAASYYYPRIQAVGTYLWNDRDIHLVGSEITDPLSSMGTTVQTSFRQSLADLMSNPDIKQAVLSNPTLRETFTSLSQADLATPLNQIGTDLADAFILDIRNVYAGLISVEQPVFTGGKIAASNKMARYAVELSDVQYEQAVRDVRVDIEQAYWQIVSIACKKSLAESYSSLLHKMMDDTRSLMQEGFATMGDSLSVKVRCNEADMLLTKASNGLALSKMLLCQKCGLPLDSDIMLADETAPDMDVPQVSEALSTEDILSHRPEMRSLDLAQKIYGRKVAVARADMMPTIALTANYLISNPNLNDGFRNEFGGRFAAGVVMKIPVFHGTEALQRTRKAKAEAELISIRMQDAGEKITLQVAQCRRLMDEAFAKGAMARSEVADAEENLRSAQEGYSEGVVPSTVLMAAQTAWLKARSQMIDTAAELRMCSVNLAKAEGRL